MGGATTVAKHEFGIMLKEPAAIERFDTYEPQKYNCLTIDDDFIEPILVDLQDLDCYGHTLQIPRKGLAYCGVTLIPPRPMDEFMRILASWKKTEYIPLLALLNEAKGNSRYIIHFGI